MSDTPVYMGIDIAAGSRPDTCVILNSRREIIHKEKHDRESLLSLISEFSDITVGVDAPISKNTGIMANADHREALGLRRKSKRYSSHRVSEYEIRRRGIYIYSTPVVLTRNSRWVESGWALYKALYNLGFSRYPAESNRLCFETYPHANFTTLIGKRPYQKSSLEGRIQRQLVLLDQGVRVKDAMLMMEEWTRYRFITGRVMVEGLLSHDELDALSGAYTAYLLHTNPGRCISVGDPRDGEIILPVAELEEAYE